MTTVKQKMIVLADFNQIICIYRAYLGMELAAGGGLVLGVTLQHPWRSSSEAYRHEGPGRRSGP